MNEDLAKTILDKTAADYNQVAEKYAQVREKNWKEMDFLFNDYLQSKDKVLDLGCGHGRFYENFISRGAEYWGADFSENILKLAKRNYPKGRFTLSEALNLPYETEFFDKVYSLAVLHHIPSSRFRLEFLREAKRALKPNGCLILTVWDLKEKRRKRKFNLLTWYWERDLDKNDILLPWYGVKDTYFHCFTLTELVALVESVGLKIIKKGEIMVGERPYNNFYVVAQKAVLD